jgi:hypothetical protein
MLSLVQMAEKLHPRAGPDAALQRLLMDGVLPLASRRRATSVDHVINSPALQHLRTQLEPALHEIFRFYATRY